MCKKIKVDPYVNIKRRKLTTPQNLFLIALKKKVFWYLDVCNPSSKFYKVKWRRPSRNFCKKSLFRINISDRWKVLGYEIVQLHKLFWLANISRCDIEKSSIHAIIIFTSLVHYCLQGEKINKLLFLWYYGIQKIVTNSLLW